MYKKTQDQFGKSSFKNRGHLSQEAQRIGLHQMVKNLPPMQETQVQSLGQEDALEEGMATHPSILAWRSPWTEEPGGLQSMGSQRVGHDWVINAHANLSFVHIYEQRECVGVILDLGVMETKRCGPALKVDHRLVIKRASQTKWVLRGEKGCELTTNQGCGFFRAAIDLQRGVWPLLRLVPRPQCIDVRRQNQNGRAIW